MLFKEYEEIMLRYMWREGAEGTGSGKIWKMVCDELGKQKKTISRASVIFAANRFVNDDIWDYSTATGKGGHHRVYFAKMSEEQLWLTVKGIVNTKINKILGIEE